MNKNLIRVCFLHDDVPPWPFSKKVYHLCSPKKSFNAVVDADHEVEPEASHAQVNPNFLHEYRTENDMVRPLFKHHARYGKIKLREQPSGLEHPLPKENQRVTGHVELCVPISFLPSQSFPSR